MIASQHEPYPSITCVNQEDLSTLKVQFGTIIDISIDLDLPTNQQCYVIKFHESSTIKVLAADMHLFLPIPPVLLDGNDAQDRLLPLFLQLKKKITYGNFGQYSKSVLANGTSFIVLSINNTPSVSTKNGVFLFLTYHTLGLTFV